MAGNVDQIEELLAAAEEELRELDSKHLVLQRRIAALRAELQACASCLECDKIEKQEEAVCTGPFALVLNSSPPEAKIALFRSLFRGREDVYPRRFESAKTGRSGYQPACANEWIRPICRKPKGKCADCEHRAFLPVSAETIRSHLLGRDVASRSQRDFTIGVYPMLPDETCWFLAVDFDKSAWADDARAFLDTCASFGVPAAIERSRSGNGGHVWIFFAEALPARQARRFGSFMLTETMERRPEVGLDSYDRFFPNQDTMPSGGLGNLIALPLQRVPRSKGNSVFVNGDLEPYDDQWAFLSSVGKMSATQVDALVEEAERRGCVVGVRMAAVDEEDLEPWTSPPSRKSAPRPIEGPLPEKVEIVLGNQIYVAKEGLPPPLRNRLIRLAAFQNPEFYKAQAMRFATFDKPRIVACCEDFPKHLGIPRGCLGEVLELLASLGIVAAVTDERFSGIPLDLTFQGALRAGQEEAADALLQHDTGVLAASTAFGKTVVACYTIAKRAVNTLVLVHRKQLLDQWVERLSTFLGMAKTDIGQIGGGKKRPTGKVDVALIQSLSAKGIVSDTVGNYGHLVVDECHHASARSFEIVARQSKAKFMLGLSATVARKDGHHPIIFMQCGPVRYRVEDRQQAAERPFSHRGTGVRLTWLIVCQLHRDA